MSEVVITPDVKPAPDTKWYVIRVVSGKERKVKEYLDKEVKINNWTNSVVQILCPVEKVFKVLNGKKVLREKTLFPGYILLEANDGKLTDDIIHAIKNVTSVIHFLGKEHPTALRKSEVNKMFGKMDEVSEQGISYRFACEGHTAQMCPVYLFGTGAERINGILKMELLLDLTQL